MAVKLKVMFVDADSGESYTGFFGDDSDLHDKSVYKTIADAQKYPLMKIFLVEAGDDPECDDVAPPHKPTIDKSQTITALEAKE